MTTNTQKLEAAIAINDAINTSRREDRIVTLGTHESGGDSLRASALLDAARAEDGYMDDAEVDYGQGRAVDVWGNDWRIAIVIA